MWRTIFTTKMFLMLGMAVVGWYGYQWFDGKVGTDTPLRMQMASQATRQITLNLSLPEGRPIVAVTPVAGDFDGIVTSHLRNWLSRRNVSIVELDWWEPFVPEKLRAPATPTLEAASARAVERQIPYLLHACVEEWTTDPERDRRLTLVARLVDVREGHTLATHVATIPSTDSPPPLQELLTVTGAVTGLPPAAYEQENALLKFVVWLATGFLLPWLASAVLLRVMNADSNLASAALILGYLGIMAFAAWYLWGRAGTLMTWALMGLVSTIWLGYLEFVCRMLDNRPEQL